MSADCSPASVRCSMSMHGATRAAVGRLVRSGNRHAKLIAGLVLLAAPAAAAIAADSRTFNVAPGELGNVLVVFGEQAGMSVGLTDPALARRHSPGARGRLSNRQALKRLLTGTGARFVQIDARSVRIVAATIAAPPSPSQPQRPAVPIDTAPIDLPQIVVTASKQATLLLDYAGTATIIDFGADKLARESTQGTAAIVARMPVMASTDLGPGRNKIFIRGVADSSFNGSSPATIGQYLGDVRLTYNAPDPALNLYDMRGVEVLEGPQGTLYGTGAIGGIIRLVPNQPDLRNNGATASIGGIAVAHGERGYDAAGMLNIVVIPGHAALRAVAYAAREPGYIDDPSRQLSDINRTNSRGGRAALRVDPGDDWSVTIGGAMQNIEARDGQYALRQLPPLTRNSVIDQPFDNDYGLVYLTASRAISGAQLTTTTSFVRHDVDTVYDATVDALSPPRQFAEALSIRLFSHETRLSRRSSAGSWVVGLSGLMARDRTTRTLGDPASPLPITGVRNVNTEVAAFGQYSHHLAAGLTATVGGRLSYVHSTGEVLDDAGIDADEPKRSQVKFSPTLALAWKPGDRFLAYLHAQSAFRPGLLEVAPAGATVNAQRIEPDSLSMVELGARFGEPGRDRLSFAASVAAARWTDIQSDLIDTTGLPYTTNIGDGRILSFEAQAGWRISPALNLEAALFLNDSKLSRPASSFVTADERELPNIPHVGARLAGSYRTRIDPNTELTIDGAVRYVGASKLGIGDPLEVAQGKYFNTSVGARLAYGAIGLSLDVTNLSDVRGNRFAFGNPFGLEQRNQITPLVPRRVRIGLDVRF
ncbi:MAG: TonB-dependent receptor [Sphingomicrobium sp.]